MRPFFLQFTHPKCQIACGQLHNKERVNPMKTNEVLSGQELREQFFAWQCRIRQIAMREDEGRPSAGMCPRLLNQSDEVLAEQIITLIIRGASDESTDFFRFQVQKTHDPKLVRERTLTYLQSTHFHGPKEFSDCLTALFAEASTLAANLIEQGKCVLEFKQFNQGYRLHCSVERLELDTPEHSATLWHNRTFSPNISDRVEILKFTPDWLASSLLAG